MVANNNCIPHLIFPLDNVNRNHAGRWRKIKHFGNARDIAVLKIILFLQFKNALMHKSKSRSSTVVPGF